MTIVFEPITTTDVSGSVCARVLFGSRGRGFDLAAGEGAGRARVVFGARGRGDAEYSVEDPIIPAHGRGSVFFGASGVGAETVDVDGSGSGGVSFRGHGYGLDIVPGDTPAPGRGHVAFVAKGRGADEGLAYGFAVERPAIVGGYGGMQFVVVNETVEFLGHQIPMPIQVMGEALALVVEQSARFDGTASMSDAIALGDGLTYVMFVAIEEGLVVDGQLSGDHTAFARVIARLVLCGEASGYVEALVLVLDAVVLAALADVMTKLDLSDAVVLSDNIRGFYEAFTRVIESLLLADALVATNTAFALVEERLLLSADLSHEADLVALVRDGIGFVLSLSIDNGEYIAWVMNTEGERPVSRYTQFPANSFAKIGGRYAAADSTGLHWLDAGDDNGEDINARLRAGLSSMGSRKVKRLPEAFIAYTTDAATGTPALLLRLIQVNEETGEKEAGNFRLRPRPAGSTRENRFTLGRGWEAVDFDFELENIAGADFDLTALEFRPLYLDRRTRG